MRNKTALSLMLTLSLSTSALANDIFGDDTPSSSNSASKSEKDQKSDDAYSGKDYKFIFKEGAKNLAAFAWNNKWSLLMGSIFAYGVYKGGSTAYGFMYPSDTQNPGGSFYSTEGTCECPNGQQGTFKPKHQPIECKSASIFHAGVNFFRKADGFINDHKYGSDEYNNIPDQLVLDNNPLCLTKEKLHDVATGHDSGTNTLSRFHIFYECEKNYFDANPREDLKKLCNDFAVDYFRAKGENRSISWNNSDYFTEASLRHGKSILNRGKDVSDAMSNLFIKCEENFDDKRIYQAEQSHFDEPRKTWNKENKEVCELLQEARKHSLKPEVFDKLAEAGKYYKDSLGETIGATIAGDVLGFDFARYRNMQFAKPYMSDQLLVKLVLDEKAYNARTLIKLFETLVSGNSNSCYRWSDSSYSWNDDHAFFKAMINNNFVKNKLSSDEHKTVKDLKDKNCQQPSYGRGYWSY